MSVAQPHQPQGGHFRTNGRQTYGRNSRAGMRAPAAAATNYNCYYNSHPNFYPMNPGLLGDFSQGVMLDCPNYDVVCLDALPSKRRKVSHPSCANAGRNHSQQTMQQNALTNNAEWWEHVPQFVRTFCNAPLVSENHSDIVAAPRSDNANAHASTTSKRNRSDFEDDAAAVFMSRDEIERCSPSRKDGIDVLQETHLRYSYCAFLQNLGFQLDLPQTTIGTAMVLCHRFFLRRSHAYHDRFLIAVAALFLASKSEETARPLNDVLRVSCESLHRQELALLYMPIDYFEQYRERILEAEQLILTTLNFELEVQHPYESLTSTLHKLGFSQPVLVNLALCLVSEGLRSSLWLQFKPHQIAAGAAYLATKFLNMNLSSCHDIWHEFRTSPSVLRDVAFQLMELF
ncbi:cyclin-T1-4-like [Andrographis paniculata]|uniref:cyclin-T1-4-like n=1 Tax=Andrographis paniculata TaxID=175694 RepID=UPI0021E97DAC|nr:cyclin-T1-4-like [Andrographis paniculata]